MASEREGLGNGRDSSNSSLSFYLCKSADSSSCASASYRDEFPLNFFICQADEDSFLEVVEVCPVQYNNCQGTITKLVIVKNEGTPLSSSAKHGFRFDGSDTLECPWLKKEERKTSSIQLTAVLKSILGNAPAIILGIEIGADQDDGHRENPEQEQDLDIFYSNAAFKPAQIEVKVPLCWLANRLKIPMLRPRDAKKEQKLQKIYRQHCRRHVRVLG